MKKIYYTLLLGMLMMGMTGRTAWSQVTATITETTATSVTFHFGTGTTMISFIVKEGTAQPRALDAITLVNRMPDSEVTATVEDLTPSILHTIYYNELPGVNRRMKTFTTLIPAPIESRLVALEAFEARLAALEAETPHTHADFTTLEAETPHTHADLTTLEAETPHTHADLTTLEAETPHTHADLTTLEAETPHTHADLTTLEAETPHTHANQAALDAHSHADLAAQTHTHGGGSSVLGFQNENARLAFIPNPTHDSFTLRGMDSYERIDIYDAQGRVVHMQTQGLSIDMAGYPAGTYIARVQTRHGTHTRQLVKE